jgi:mannan endo-1,4-beta-mannosidase
MLFDVAHLRLLVAGLVAAALLTPASAAAGLAPSAANAARGEQRRSAEPLAKQLHVANRVLFGVAAAVGQNQFAGIEAAAAAARKAPGLVNVYQSLSQPGLDLPALERIGASGAVPMVTLELRGRAAPHGASFSPAGIARGAHDARIRRWAAAARDWNRLLLLRFAPEMNGTWNPWSVGIGGTTSKTFVAAWRRVYELFESEGAHNVEWVWAPNVDFPGATPLRSVYPGDHYVDWVGIDGYNWGRSRRSARWQSFDEIFGPTLAQLRRLTTKPIMLAETASTEVGGDKAAWISDFFRSLERNRDIRAFVWFNYSKETDWRIQSSEAARSAFARGVADPRYVGVDRAAASP